jgi:RimJ/RimL family protein N-acetyltransferase
VTYRIAVKDDAVGKWVHERTAGQWVPALASTIGVYKDERIVAGVVFSQWTGPNIFVAVAVDDPRAVTRRFLYLCCWYPFEQLKCRRVTALVDEDNSRSISSVEHLGFTREATLVDAAPNGDVIVFRMLKRDCRWLHTLKTRELRNAENPLRRRA